LCCVASVIKALAMSAGADSFPVYLEVGRKRVVAGALEAGLVPSALDRLRDRPGCPERRDDQEAVDGVVAVRRDADRRGRRASPPCLTEVESKERR